MRNATLQLLANAPGISRADVAADTPGVRITGIARPGSPNYLIAYLDISAVTPGRIRDFGERMQAQILRRDVHGHAFSVHIAQNMGTVQRMGGKKHVDRDAGNILFLP